VAIIFPAARRRVQGEAGDLGAERLAPAPARRADTAADPGDAPSGLGAGGDAIRRRGLVQERQRRRAVGGRHARRVVPVPVLRLLDPRSVRFGDHDAAAQRLAPSAARSSPRRYAADALRLATFARDRGARVVAITDAATAPLARIADVSLVVPAGHPVLPASSTAILFAVECLVAGVMAASDDNVSRAEALTRALQGYLVDEGGR
jgi:hypothetical protein